MNENDAFYNALIDVAAWDKENTLDRFMNSDSLGIWRMPSYIRIP